MTLELFLASLRHALTAAGVYVTAAGVTDADGWSQFTGAVLVIVGFGWSAWRKWNRQQRTGSAS